MIGDILQPTHLLLVLVVALLVLGPKRLPELARTLGTGMRDFKAAISGEDHGEGSVGNTNHIVGETAPPTTLATEATTFTPDAEYSPAPAELYESELPYSHEPEPPYPHAPEPPYPHAPEPPYPHAPQPTDVDAPEPIPEPAAANEPEPTAEPVATHEPELTSAPAPAHEPSAQPAEAPQEPTLEYHAPAYPESPEPTEVHAPAGSQPDSA